MNLLINDMLVRRIIRIHNLHRLPPPFPFAPIAHLKHCRGNQNRYRNRLRVHPSLHQFLLRRQIGRSANDAQRDTHAQDPGCADDGVAVFFAEIHEALEGGFLGFLFGVQPGRFILVAFFGVAGGFEGAGESVGCYDCC